MAGHVTVNSDRLRKWPSLDLCGAHMHNRLLSSVKLTDHSNRISGGKLISLCVLVGTRNARIPLVSLFSANMQEMINRCQRGPLRLRPVPFGVAANQQKHHRRGAISWPLHGTQARWDDLSDRPARATAANRLSAGGHWIILAESITSQRAQVSWDQIVGANLENGTALSRSRSGKPLVYPQALCLPS